MATRRVDGTALLVAGVPFGDATLNASAVHTLGQIGEALLATGAAWQLKRVVSGDRATLKRHVDELVSEPARVVILALVGAIVTTTHGPALVTGEHPLEYPDDAALPLAWIRERIFAAKAEQVVIVLSATGDGVPRGWLDALATEKPTHLVAVERSGASHPIIDALLTGLCGDALDPRTGTVTMASLAQHLGMIAGVERQASNASETIAQPPPLAGLWDVRRSQLAQRPPRKPSDDNLTGSVLPGRFRLDRLVARGTFGTVYRARQLAVERDVAVKVLHADIDPSSEDGRLFVHEIRSVGRIDHPNVVRIHQADITHDGRLFFAMELLDGQDLQTLGTAQGPLPRDRAVELGRQLLAGLGAAHDAGLVHADVKPANALLVVAPTTAINGTGGERLVLVDFGLSRLRAPDRPTASAGGTPAYMAPEQLHEGRVDARSDLFSAALVLVYLLTGWRRPNALALVPPLDTLPDDDLREVLRKALDKDPANRYPTAAAFSAALQGVAAPPQPNAPPFILPFRHLAPLTESDRDRLYGREADLAALAEAVLFRRSVIYTAPSGTGKTSLLRAGLLPRLEALGIRAIYMRCRADAAAALANEIAPGAASLATAIANAHGHTKLVLVLDQLEAALADADFIRTVLAPHSPDVSVVLSVREDYLARLVALTPPLDANIPVLRLPPLSPAGARAAILGPLSEARLAIEPELLDTLLDDLTRAAGAIGPEMGWGDAVRAVYPPHLQLACSVLYEALGSGEATITLAHYRSLGGFDAIVGEHLDRVLDTELGGDGGDVIARDLFVALVTTAHERTVRTESELLAMVSRHPAPQVLAVLELLRSRGLLVRVRGADDEPSWELIHDSLVPRVLAWLDRRDLDRRRAIELVRYHLRRSRPATPSLLGRAELRELRPHAAAVAELDTEWKTRTTSPDDWTPSRLVARSRQVHRRRFATLASIVGAALAVACVAMYRSHVEEQRARTEARLKSLDLGRFTLSLEPFDWDPTALRATPVAASSMTLDWKLHAPDPEDPTEPGPLLDPVMATARHHDGNALVENVETRGGRAFLVVTRGPCPPSIVPLKQLPGYTLRDREPPTLHIAVPTCQATLADTIEIPAGPFIYGGVGEPPSPYLQSNPQFATETRIDLPAFRIDRTEVTNAAFAMFSHMASLTGITHPSYPDTPELNAAGEPNKPVTNLDWSEAWTYCRFLGKMLPTSEQWVRALRGGERLRDGPPNPWPRRNYPWGLAIVDQPARLVGIGSKGPAPVGSFAGDRSPDGVCDLAGNIQEWTNTHGPVGDGFRVARGGTWALTLLESLGDWMSVENPRAVTYRDYHLGARCALPTETRH